MSALNQDYPFYRGAGRLDALDLLCDAGLRGGCVVLAAPEGAGVSRLLGEAAMSLVDNAAVVRVDGRETPSRNVLMRALLSHFGVTREDFAATLERALASEPLVLVVDNAEQLGEEALATLVLLRERLGPRFALLLGGLPGLVEKLTSGGLEITDEVALEPLDADECAAFLGFVIGEEVDDEDAELRRVESGGWPGALLAQAPPPVLSPGSWLSGVRVPWKHLAAVGGLLLVVLLFWPRAEREDEAVSLVLPPQSVAGTVTAPARAPAAAADDALRPAAPVEQSSGPAAATADSAGASSPARPQPPAPATEAPDTASSAAGGSPTAAQAPAHAPVRAPVHNEAPAAPTAPSSPASTAPAATSPPPQVVRADQPPSLSGLDAELGYRRDEWLLGASGDDWMLQVTLAGTEDAARALVDQLGAQRGAYYRGTRNGRSVFIVLAGPYTNRTAATEGRAQLPATLAAAGPFPRQISAIQEELRGP